MGHQPAARQPRVRKHRAPKGALRQRGLERCRGLGHVRQKAPSAKRCIKTPELRVLDGELSRVRKHRAPKGALRHLLTEERERRLVVSESTERQKVH